MLLTVRRLGGIGLCALLAACPTSVGTPTAKFTATPSTGVKVGQVVQLDGSTSSEPQNRELTYAWAFAKLPNGSAATFNDSHAVTPSFVADVPGTFTVSLTVANSFIASAAATQDIVVSQCGANAPTTGTLAVNPAAPGVGVTTQISAPNAADADNAADCGLSQTINYQWQMVSQPAGSTAALNNATATAPSFVPDIGGNYVVRLTLTDSTGRSSTPAETTITAAACGSNTPVVNTITPSVELPGLGQSVQLTADVTDLDNSAGCGNLGQTFTYAWTALNLPQGSSAKLNSNTSATPSFTTDIAGAYAFRLIVTDSTGRASLPKDITLTASTCGSNPPVPTLAFSPAKPQIGTAVQLSATVTDDDNSATCNLSQTFTYGWSLRSQPSGSLATLNNPAATNPTFTADVAGNYVIELTVTDSAGIKSAPTQQTIAVTACGTASPVIGTIAQATPASAPNPGQQVTVSSTVTDADDTCKATGAPNQKQTYAWTFKARPSDSQAFFEDPTAATATFTADTAGTYQLQLIVTDETGRSSAPKFLDITTTRCGLAAPVISATSFSPGSINPNTAVTLGATWSDTDNTTCGLSQSVTLAWTRLQAPPTSAAVLPTPVSAAATAPGAAQNVTFTPDVIGTYQFQVIATDSKGLSSAPAFVTFSTTTCGAAVPTIASFGASASTSTGPFTATLSNLTPTQPVFLNVVGDDADNHGTCNLNQK
ncbi:MAG: hypothetical protein JST92_10195, partial [Deltaproteobacteria bacterium]|nr:hypothetical protein [Deltaproteobacteria bacterium]